jgi:hypothetical protein
LVLRTAKEEKGKEKIKGGRPPNYIHDSRREPDLDASGVRSNASGAE